MQILDVYLLNRYVGQLSYDEADPATQSPIYDDIIAIIKSQISRLQT